MRLSTSFLALAAVAALSAPAAAADFGGNCCADLEERIAELEATTARKGNRKVSLTIYGQVNEAIGWWDDGNESNTYIFTNDHSRTRFGFKGKAKITDDWYAGYKLEIGVRISDQGDLSADDDGPAELDLRHSHWFIGSKTYGQVSVGEAAMANEGITQISLARTGHFSSQDIFDATDDFEIVSSRTGDSIGQDWLDVVQVLEPGEGSRGQLIRYDTPTFAGFKLSAAWGEDDIWNVALRYAGEFGAFRVAAGVGYGEQLENDEECAEFDGQNSTAQCEEYGGSVSVMHTPTGLFVTGAYGHREDDSRARRIREEIAAGNITRGDDENEFWMIQAGIEQKWISLGKTTVFGGYHDRDAGTPVTNGGANLLFANDDGVNNFRIIDAKVEMWEVGLNQEISAAAMDLYLQYKNYEADITTTGGKLATEDWQTVIGGSRIKF